MVEFEDLAGMTPTVASQLRKKDVTTVARLAKLNFESLQHLLHGVSYKTIREIQQRSWEATGGWFTPGSVLVEQKKSQLVFPTGCKSLDGLLGGGVRSNSITEFAGEYATGKTECLLTLLAETLGRNKDYGALYFDSEESFSEIRAIEIANSRGYDAEEMLDRFTMLKVRTTDQYKVGVEKADQKIKDKNVKLFLIDSAVAPLRAEYVGRETLPERQQILNQIIHEVRFYATIYNLAVAVTNQVVANPNVVWNMDPVQMNVPTGGHILGHGAETRVYLRKARGNHRIARLIDSSWLPPGECVFQITKKGIEDATEEEKKEEEKTENVSGT